VALTSIFSVELRGIEPDALPGVLGFELSVRSISVQFGPARYQRLCFRVLTASRRPRENAMAGIHDFSQKSTRDERRKLIMNFWQD